jgi:hypothetical protein
MEEAPIEIQRPIIERCFDQINVKENRRGIKNGQYRETSGIDCNHCLSCLLVELIAITV